MISKSLQEKISHQAFRCPSVHNVQPWLVKFHEDSLTIYEDPNRTLSIGDPQLHDHEVSMGAFVEGVGLILGTAGLRISQIIDLHAREIYYKGRRLRERFHLRVDFGTSSDPLAKEILQRRSYRGIFAPNTDEDRKIVDSALNTENSVLVSSFEELKSWAELYDLSVVRGNSKSPLQEELYNWLRLTKKHRQYDQDGLNREALSLSPLEGVIANSLLKPSIYKKLHQWGLARYLVSEAPQIRSATGLLFIFKPQGTTSFDSGRIFYRLWLELTHLGFAACPLSSLVDDPEACHQIKEKFKNKVPLNVLRVGRPPQNSLYTSPRLRLEEKIIPGVSYEK